MTTPTVPELVTRAQFETAMARIEGRFDVLRAQLETAIERASVTNIRWTVGMILPLHAVLFGFMLFIVGREFPR